MTVFRPKQSEKWTVISIFISIEYIVMHSESVVIMQSIIISCCWWQTALNPLRTMWPLTCCMFAEFGVLAQLRDVFNVNPVQSRCGVRYRVSTGGSQKSGTGEDDHCSLPICNPYLISLSVVSQKIPLGLLEVGMCRTVWRVVLLHGGLTLYPTSLAGSPQL